MTPATVLLAENHTLVRQGLRTMLESQTALRVVGEAADGLEAVALAASLDPDIILMDVMMPNLNGLEALRRLHERHARARVVMLSMHANTGYAARALRSGALGYVLKDADFSEIVRAIEAALQGERYLSPQIEAETLSLLAQEQVPAPTLDLLSAREKEVLKLVAEGNTNSAVAIKLKLSVRTIEAHRARIMARLHVSSQAELIRFAIEQGLVD